MPDLKPRSAYQENVEQRQFSKDKGGIHTDVRQDKLHQKETQIKHNQCPVSNQPASYTEEAERLDQIGDRFQKETKYVDKVLEHGDKAAHEKCSKISELETEAQKAAKELKSEQEKHLKKQGKLEGKLAEQEAKTMKIAKELAAEQEEERRIEAERAQEALQKEAEARRLAQELAKKREQDRRFAEEKMHKLEAQEREMMEKAKELANHQAREVHEFEIKQKELKVDIETARKGMDALKERHDREKKALDDNINRLKSLRNEAETARQLGEKFAKERAELEKRLNELDIKAEQERQRFNQLNHYAADLQQGIQTQRKQLSEEETALRDREQLVQTKEKETKTFEAHGKEQLKNEEIALKKAKDLAGKTAEERKELQEDVARLVTEEQKAKVKAAELQNEPHIKVEQKPAVVDVFKRERYQTTEPVITEAEAKDTHSACSEDKSFIGKIIDKITPGSD